MADCPLYAGRTRPGRRRSSSFPLSCPALTRSPRLPPAAPVLRRLAPHQTCPAAAPAAPPALRGGGYGAPAATLHPQRGPGHWQGSPPSSENGRCITLARGVGPARLTGPPTLGDRGRAHICTRASVAWLLMGREILPTRRVFEKSRSRRQGRPVSTNGRLCGHLGPSARRPALRLWSGMDRDVLVSTLTGAEVVTPP